MRAHPEIREGVQREKERMIEEHDRMSLEQNQDSNVTAPWGDGDDSTINSSGNDGNDNTNTNRTNTAIFNAKEISREVIQQIKSDMTKLINYLTPSPEVQQMLKEQQMKFLQFYKQRVLPALKEEIIPALKSFAVVAKDWGGTVVEMTQRYIRVTFTDEWERRHHADGDDEGDDGEKLPNQNSEHNHHQNGNVESTGME